MFCFVLFLCSCFVLFCFLFCLFVCLLLFVCLFCLLFSAVYSSVHPHRVQEMLKYAQVVLFVSYCLYVCLFVCLFFCLFFFTFSAVYASVHPHRVQEMLKYAFCRWFAQPQHGIKAGDGGHTTYNFGYAKSGNHLHLGQLLMGSCGVCLLFHQLLDRFR